MAPCEGSTVLFRGCGVPAVREWVAQCCRADPGLTTQCSTVAGMASPEGLAEQRRDMTPRCVRGAACTCSCQSIKWLGRGSGCRGGVAPGASSEAEFRPRVRSALERGGPRPRGRSALERGGFSPEGAWANCFGGPLGPPGLRLCCACFGLANLFAFVYFTKEDGVFPGCLGDPYGRPRQSEWTRVLRKTHNGRIEAVS
jgi:hypothetical protein